jgi:hypothetical protein
MHKSLIAVLLPSLLILLIIADGYFYSAHAQCAPTDKIYIDPRLVPMRRPITLDEYASTMNNHALPDYIKQQTHEAYINQNQPIVIPYGTGKVLVDPTNPCIQQFIP